MSNSGSHARLKGCSRREELSGAGDGALQGDLKKKDETTQKEKKNHLRKAFRPKLTISTWEP
jgi:hypothetical protein